MNKIGVILKINIKSAILIMNNFWCKKLHPTDYQQFHDVAILQYLLNHSSPSITLRYIGITQDTVEETLKVFEL